jgi:hypothetical protein
LHRRWMISVEILALLPAERCALLSYYSPKLPMVY